MQVSAAMVKDLRQKTGLPMMDCKKALSEADGDMDKAIALLKEKGQLKRAKMSDREAGEGRIATFFDPDAQRGAIVEVRCETAPVADNEEFQKFARGVAIVAARTGRNDYEAIKSEPMPDVDGTSVGDFFDDVFNRIRENMKVATIATLEGHVGAYIHHDGKTGVLVQMSGDTPENVIQDVCMHIAAMNPPCRHRSQADPAEVATQKAAFEKEAEGKPPEIMERMVTGKMDRWYSEFVLLDQPFVKDDKMSVQKMLDQSAGGATVEEFVRLQVGAA